MANVYVTGDTNTPDVMNEEFQIKQILHWAGFVAEAQKTAIYGNSIQEKIKNNTKRINQQKHTLHYDIGKRISEEDIVDHVSNSFHQRNGRWPSKFCNETDLLIDGNNDIRDPCSTNSSNFRH